MSKSQGNAPYQRRDGATATLCDVGLAPATVHRSSSTSFARRYRKGGEGEKPCYRCPPFPCTSFAQLATSLQPVAALSPGELRARLQRRALLRTELAAPGAVGCHNSSTKFSSATPFGGFEIARLGSATVRVTSVYFDRGDRPPRLGGRIPPRSNRGGEVGSRRGQATAVAGSAGSDSDAPARPWPDNGRTTDAGRHPAPRAWLVPSRALARGARIACIRFRRGLTRRPKIGHRPWVLPRVACNIRRQGTVPLSPSSGPRGGGVLRR